MSCIPRRPQKYPEDVNPSSTNRKQIEASCKQIWKWKMRKHIWNHLLLTHFLSQKARPKKTSIIAPLLYMDIPQPIYYLSLVRLFTQFQVSQCSSSNHLMFRGELWVSGMVYGCFFSSNLYTYPKCYKYLVRCLDTQGIISNRIRQKGEDIYWYFIACFELLSSPVKMKWICSFLRVFAEASAFRSSIHVEPSPTSWVFQWGILAEFFFMVNSLVIKIPWSSKIMKKKGSSSTIH